MKSWIVFIFLILPASPLLAQITPLTPFEQMDYYECFENSPGQPLCEEVAEPSSNEEDVLIVPFALKFNNQELILLSAQITSKRRARSALRERLSRNVRQLFSDLRPSDNGLSFHLPYLPTSSTSYDQVCDQPTQCASADATFLAEMKKRGYGNILMTVIPFENQTLNNVLGNVIMTHDFLYSGIVPQVTLDEGEVIVRSGNIGSWMTAFLSAGVVVLIKKGGIYAFGGAPLVTVAFAVGTGTLVLIALEQYQEINHAADNINYLTSHVTSPEESVKNEWIIFNDFYRNLPN